MHTVSFRDSRNSIMPFRLFMAPRLRGIVYLFPEILNAWNSQKHQNDNLFMFQSSRWEVDEIYYNPCLSEHTSMYTQTPNIIYTTNIVTVFIFKNNIKTHISFYPYIHSMFIWNVGGICVDELRWVTSLDIKHCV